MIFRNILIGRQKPDGIAPAMLINAGRGFPPLRLFRFSWVFLLGWLVVLSCPAIAQTTSPSNEISNTSSPYSLRLAQVELSGAGRTSLATVYKFLPLHPGQPIDQKALVEAVAALRQEGLFKSVSYYTKPGRERGRLILVLDVEEHGLDFRWAAGNTDIDGWYLVPAMLAYDNAFGKGGLLDLQVRLGFRHGGYFLRYLQPRAGDGRNYWGARLSAITTDWPYFSDGVEFRHEVKTAALATVFGRRYAENVLAEIGLKFEGVKAEDHSEAHTMSQDGSISQGDRIDEGNLPLAIQAAVGETYRTIFHADWQHDTRSKEKRAGTPVSGIWGRLKGRYIFQETGGSFPGIQTDLRVYRNIPGGVLAARLKGAWVGERAAFYDRLYLGGMYTVRGFSDTSLSAPGGDTWLFSGSMEYRSRILGDHKGTKLAGVFFLDAGASGSSDSGDPYQGIAVGAGYGLRLRVWWLDWIGLDVGFPLTDRPLDMRFQVTASIGWSF